MAEGPERQRSAGTPVATRGTWTPQYEAVADVFRENFEARLELGASLTLIVNGETVVDLWGGIADPATGREWDADTISVVFSCTKAGTALVAHLLAARGVLDLDMPVAEVWPEFAAAGKSAATTRMMLDHTVGLPAIREPLKPECLVDWDYMVERLAAEAPFWEPGTRTGYHALTYGFLIGEVVRRAAGRPLGAIFREEIAAPLGLDFAIGLPEADEARVAPVVPYRPGPEEAATPFMTTARQRGTIANLFVFNHGDWAVRGVNTRAGRAAEIGAAGGVTNARGLAGMYAALVEGGSRLGLDAATIASFAQASSATHSDATLIVPTRFGPGFMLSMDNRRRGSGGDSVILGARAFGHVGAGGSIGFADPDCGLAFGYTMNRLGGGVFLNERGQTLVDAAYRALGYRSNHKGFWSR